MIDRDLLRDLTESYLKFIISEASGSVSPNFDALAPFGELGINSFSVLKIIRSLESDFGTLPKSLLFENFNVSDLAGYFLEKHEATLCARFAVDPGSADSFALAGSGPGLQELRGIGESPGFSPATTVMRAEPIRILEKEAYRHPDLNELVQSLFTRHKSEGCVSRGTRIIAPNLFIGSARRGYFNYGRSKEIVLVYSYTGPQEYAQVLLEEMFGYCVANHFQLNVLAADEIPPIAGQSLFRYAIRRLAANRESQGVHA